MNNLEGFFGCFFPNVTGLSSITEGFEERKSFIYEVVLYAGNAD